MNVGYYLSCQFTIILFKKFTSFVNTPTKEMIRKLPDDKIKLMIEDVNPDSYRIRSTLIFVEEYIPTNLNNFLIKNNDKNSISKYISICKGIGEALSFLFKNKIVHRDIKKNNILIKENDCPVICDFGWASILEEDLTLRMNEYAPLGGNFEHIAPEILNSQNQQKK